MTAKYKVPFEIDPEMISMSTAYEIIQAQPDIDTPELCLALYSTDTVDPEISGSFLAGWLMEWHLESWEATCAFVDELLDEGMISFSDDGELRAIGY
tara:strand:- start:3 stop:293 length:291 start_codon:yes stop_codon:yes gene_type:complete